MAPKSVQQFDPVSAFVLNLSSSIVKGIKIIMIIIIKEQMKKDSIKTLENSQLILLKSARENRIIDSGKRVKRAHISFLILL